MRSLEQILVERERKTHDEIEHNLTLLTEKKKSLELEIFQNS
jgi:hypothetical protein